METQHDTRRMCIEMREVPSPAPPLAHEALWMLEWIALRASRVYRGDGVPRGHGEPVIVVPGFLGSYAGCTNSMTG